jgi:hypothetical protein
MCNCLGDRYWKVKLFPKLKLVQGFPHNLAADYRDLPQQLDAAFSITKEVHNRRMFYTFFLEGSKYYRMTNSRTQVVFMPGKYIFLIGINILTLILYFR